MERVHIFYWDEMDFRIVIFADSYSKAIHILKENQPEHYMKFKVETIDKIINHQ